MLVVTYFFALILQFTAAQAAYKITKDPRWLDFVFTAAQAAYKTLTNMSAFPIKFTAAQAAYKRNGGF